MIDLKEKQDILEDEFQFESSNTVKRVRPSRASYYETYGFSAPSQAAAEEPMDDGYTIKLVKANKTLTPSVSKTNYDNSYDVAELDYTTQPLPNLKAYKNLTAELMPSSETMNTLQKAREETEETEEVVNFKVNKKGALMLVLFAVVIIALFTMIIVNAVSLIGLGNEVGDLGQYVADQQNAISDLQTDIGNTNPDPYGQAVSAGFSAKESSGTLTIETNMPQQQEFTGSTNLFDWILNNLFGFAGVSIMIAFALSVSLLVIIGHKKNRNKFSE